VLIHTLVPKFLPKSIRGDEEDKKNEKKIRIKIEEGEEGEWNEEGMNDKNKTRIPLQNSAIEPKKDIKCICYDPFDTGRFKTLIRCTSCFTWQHSVCYNSYNSAEHSCFQCNHPYDPHYDDTWMAC
jgi:hypothetical protein